ncbi:isocitrate lyase/PEP mutase family protein [Cupriavidus sp. 30B13]|uniref:isocitrate lyase/PEP mutase family protein n=1 Tax=Cupriavidus sp. 30B13 TaxID=3384241 RepID=UPI003B8F9265
MTATNPPAAARAATPAALRASLRDMLRDEPFIVAPAVHDVFSLRLVEQAGYRSACISGAMLSYGLLGVPDIGLLTLSETVEHCRRLARASSIPVTADGDAGFGNARGVHYAVELFEEAGAAGLNLEDQVVPRRWGAQAAKEVVCVAEMVSKIRAACAARRDGNFLIIARTDAFACESAAQVVARAQAYEQAGADLILPIAPRSGEHVEQLVRALEIPVTLSIGTGLAPSPSSANLPLERIRSLGVRRVSLTTLLPGAAAQGMAEGLQALTRSLNGEILDPERELATRGVRRFDALFAAAAQAAFEDELLQR